MFEADAKWIYDKTIPGDVVLYENTGGTTVQSWNGAGGLWNIPWDQWLKKSALGRRGHRGHIRRDVDLGRDLAGGERLNGFDAATSIRPRSIPAGSRGPSPTAGSRAVAPGAGS